MSEKEIQQERGETGRKKETTMERELLVLPRGERHWKLETEMKVAKKTKITDGKQGDIETEAATPQPAQGPGLYRWGEGMPKSFAQSWT